MRAPLRTKPSAAPDRRWRRLLAVLLLGLLTAGAVSEADAKAEPLEPDEDVLFLPATARELEDGRIELDLQAWIYELDRQHILDASLARYLGLAINTMSPSARHLFTERTSLFHAEPEEDTVLEIDFGQGTPHVLMPSSDDAGRTQLRTVVAVRPHPHHAPWLRFQARVASPARAIEGRVLLVPASGLSVISDIDDTVKMRDAGFPLGSMHLRESTTWGTLIPGDGESRPYKLAAIARLMEDFPQRRFLLIGDSGELDPEIYGEVARTRPDRVEAVVIRDVTGEGRGARRYASAFKGVAPERWHIYRDGEAWPLQ